MLWPLTGTSAASSSLRPPPDDPGCKDGGTARLEAPPAASAQHRQLSQSPARQVASLVARKERPHHTGCGSAQASAAAFSAASRTSGRENTRTLCNKIAMRGKKRGRKRRQTQTWRRSIAALGGSVAASIGAGSLLTGSFVNGMDEEMAKWLENQIAREKQLKGDKAGEIMSIEEDDRRRKLEKIAEERRGEGAIADKIFRGGDHEDDVEGKSAENGSAGQDHERTAAEVVPFGTAPSTPPDLVADARRYLEMEHDRDHDRGWKLARKLIEKAASRSRGSSSSGPASGSSSSAAHEDDVRDADRYLPGEVEDVDSAALTTSSKPWGHEAVRKGADFFDRSSQWEKGSLHEKTVAAQRRNLMHADNPNFPRAVSKNKNSKAAGEIVVPSTDYRVLAEHERSLELHASPEAKKRRRAQNGALNPLHPSLTTPDRVFERRTAQRRMEAQEADISRYVLQEDSGLQEDYNLMLAQLEFEQEKASADHSEDGSLLFGGGAASFASTRELSLSSSADSSVAASNPFADCLQSGSFAKTEARINERVRKLKASTAFRKGGLKAVEEDLAMLKDGGEKKNLEDVLLDLEDIAEEYEEESVMRELLNPLGPFESVGTLGKNEVSFYETAEDNHKSEVVRDLRRALKDQRAGMRVVDVVRRLRKKSAARRRRRRMESSEKQGLSDGEDEKKSALGGKCVVASAGDSLQLEAWKDPTLTQSGKQGSRGLQLSSPATALFSGDPAFAKDPFSSALDANSLDENRLAAAYRKLRLSNHAREQKFNPRRSLSSHLTGHFFTVQPRALAGHYDGRDEYCKKWTESPPVVSRTNGQFPRDGTGIMEQQNKACGVGIVNYFFTTSDLPDYAANPDLQQVIAIELKWATFIVSETCENLLDASGGLAVGSCRFQANEAKFFLSQGLVKNTAYRLSVRHFNPETVVRAAVMNDDGLKEIAPTLDARGFVVNTGAQSEVLRIGEPNDPAAINVRQYERIDVRKGSMAGVNVTNPDIATAVLGRKTPASLHFSHEYLSVENTFSLVVKIHQGQNIEQPTQPQPLQFIKHNAKHPAADTENAQRALNIQWEWDDVLVNLGPDGTPSGNRPNQNLRGYVNGFSWRPSAEYDSRQGTTGILFTFGFRFYGTLRAPQGRAVFLSQPSHIWELASLSTSGGTTECVGVQYNPGVGLKCNVFKYPGYQGNNLANGIFFFYDSASTVAIDTKISLRLNNPAQAVNMFWLSYTYQYMNGIMRAPFTMELDKPIATQGAGSGEILSTSSSAVNAKNKIVMLFKPGNTVIPMSSILLSGYLVILPPTGFEVDKTVAPSSVAGYNALPCSEWPVSDQQQNRWLCNIRDLALFRDASYAVQLGVINPGEPQINTAWRVEVWQLDRSKPLATTREIKGIAVSGTMVASFEPYNQVLGNVNMITFKFQPSRDVTLAANATFSITAPEGFQISKRCAGFVRGTLPADTVCKGTDSVSATLRFPGLNAIKQGELYEFMLDVVNPSTNLLNTPNVWRFDTVRPDGIVSDTTNYPGFFLYPSEFASFTVIPQSRLAGTTRLDVRFVSKVPIATGSYIRIMAPIGIKWSRTNAAFSTASSVTGTNSMSTEPAVIGSSSAVDNTLDNMLLLRLSQNLLADFEYGIAHNIIVPAQTPIPNRYWIDTYVETGSAAAGDFDYIASLGAPGFRTQALFNTIVSPYNNVELAWNNPTTVKFETTTAVSSVLSDQGTVMVQSELYVQAPPGFTFICPTKGWNPPTQVIPDGFSKMPADAECYINHQVAEERRVVHLLFRQQGLSKNTKYIFEVEIVNAGTVNPTTNKFVLETRVDGVKVEGVEIGGYDLAKPMSNTRYEAPGFLETGEDRTVDAYNNQIAFVMGITQPMPPSSVLEVGGPNGFLFSPRCIGDVGWAQKFSSADSLVFPDATECTSMAATTGEGNKIRITLKDALIVGKYPFFVKVQNPNFSIPPEKNFWTIRVYEPGSSVATMAEAWVVGFDIQVVKEVEVYPYNPGNGIPGEAAPNPLDIRFKLTTRLPSFSEEANGALILVVPPTGFHFPSVCRNFMQAPYDAPYLAHMQYAPLPTTTVCNPSDLLKPELVKLYYRLGHPNFYLEFGNSETMISDDIKWEPFFRASDLSFRVRSVPRPGPAFANLVRAGYELESMVCYPEGDSTTRNENCLTTFRTAVISTCGTIDGQVAIGTTQATIDNYVASFADPSQAMDTISDCISQKVWKPLWDELLVPTEMYLSGSALILKLGTNTQLVAEQAYAFRVMVENPMETFDNVQDTTRWWVIETRKMMTPSNNKRSQIKDRYDINYKVYSFPVYPRISLFQLQTLNYIGQSETDVKISFDITSDLAPQKTIMITAPDEFSFRIWTGTDSLTMNWNPTLDLATGLYLNLNADGTSARPCIDPAMSAADYQVMDQLFPRSAIKDITRLPEYVQCLIVSNKEITITNTEPVRGGRTLMAGPVYEFLVDEVVNPPRTPFTASNLWRIVADTTTSLGQEVWATEGWTIFPELVTTEITSSNPANGLFTTFTIHVAVLTQIPPLGSILLRAPRSDFYFGERLAFDGPPPDLLDPVPRASGGSPPRPPLGQGLTPGSTEIPCTIVAPTPPGNLQFQCPISLIACDREEYLKELDPGPLPDGPWQLYGLEIGQAETDCSLAKTSCKNRRYEKLFSCRYRTILKERVMTPLELDADKALVQNWNSANTKQLSWEPYEAQLEITLGNEVTMKQDQTLTFLITGYNTLFRNYTTWQNEWIFATRNADSGKTTLDERKGVAGFKLYGVVYVSRIFAQETKVSQTYNRVTVTFRLTNPVKQRGLVRIQYPAKFEPVQGASGAGTNTIDTSQTVPRKAKKSQRGNIIELDSEDEDFPAGLDMQITITLSNPSMSPPPEENIWIFETFEVSPSAPTGTTPPASALTMVDLNEDVEGFRIFGAFRSTRVASMIASPTVVNTIAVSFVLESELAFDPSARVQIYMPKGFTPVDLCGRWSRSYDKNDFLESTSSLDAALVYTEIPRGTSCNAIQDPDNPAIELRPGSVIQYGLDYAFTFEVINAVSVPDENNWRFQTMLNNVVLHLDRNVFGFSLQELQDIVVDPYDTTRSVMGRLAVQMRSTKRVPGASDIVITAPIGFKPLNTLFTILSIPGGHTLASTTTSTKSDNEVTFTLDSQDRIEPNLKFGMEIWITNPQFTPASNVWKFEIKDSNKNFIDIKQSYPGYDITGAMYTDVKAGFPTKSRANKIEVIFVPSTIMNQADFENIFYLKAPAGYAFPPVCREFGLKYTNREELEDSSMGAQAEATKFPPENMQCVGSGNETVTIKFPRGSGLLVFNYTLQIEVDNAAEDHVENIWHFETRKKASSAELEYTIVDANRTISGFSLQDLEMAPEEPGSAAGLRPGLGLLGVLALHVLLGVSGVWGIFGSFFGA